MICLILLNKFSDVLPAFTCASAIGNLWRICLGVNILSSFWSEALRLETLATWPTQSVILVSPFPSFHFASVSLSKVLRTFCVQLRSIIAFLRVSSFFSFLTDLHGFVDSLKISISTFNLIYFSSALYSHKSLL